MPVAVFTAGLPYSSLFAADIIIVAGVLYDFVSRGRVHAVWLWGGAVVVLADVVRLLISHTLPWFAFARFMSSLYVP